LPWTLWWDQPLKKLVCLFIHLWPSLRNEGFEHLWHYMYSVSIYGLSLHYM
jgi:hypothetical protein